VRIQIAVDEKRESIDSHGINHETKSARLRRAVKAQFGSPAARLYPRGTLKN